MSNYAIQVENLGKRYNIGRLQQNGNRDLRDVITDTVKAPYKRARALLSGEAYGALGTDETIWALKDVSFNVQHGEVVGIIGHNGAGKSTLLKILSRITQPTEGRIRLHGRVGSLLEVGTGFHQDLTGRENVYLNGAILGMPRAEIDRKFDEIVDFSGVEKFIDTPVKFYSSGMGLRLGFAVAAHLEPDILVVDEVLAVGDAEFQKRCLGKMEDVANQGRTVLFVSHDIASVEKLCTSGILLQNGQLSKRDNITTVISTYINQITNKANINSIIGKDGISLSGVNELKLTGIGIYDENHEVTDEIYYGRVYQIRIEYNVFEELPYARVGFWITDDKNTIIFDAYDSDNPSYSGKRQRGTYISTFNLPEQFMTEGRYKITVHIDIPHIKRLVHIDNCVEFRVATQDVRRQNLRGKRRGFVFFSNGWHVEKK